MQQANCRDSTGSEACRSPLHCTYDRALFLVLQAATLIAKSAPKANPLSAPSVIRAGASSTTIVS